MTAATKTKTDKAEKVVKSDAELLTEREAELKKKYKKIVPGTIQREESGPHAGKLSVEIECSECNETRRVATSDLFQVAACVDCTRELRNQKRRKARAAVSATKKPAAKAKAKGKKEKVAKKGAKKGGGRRKKEAAPVETQAVATEPAGEPVLSGT